MLGFSTILAHFFILVQLVLPFFLVIFLWKKQALFRKAYFQDKFGVFYLPNKLTNPYARSYLPVNLFRKIVFFGILAFSYSDAIAQAFVAFTLFLMVKLLDFLLNH
jgi:hypothetical protein